MEKEYWKAGNMLYPVPAVLVSTGDMNDSNVFTVAWTGTVCTNPAMLYISVRPERYSYELIMKNKDFVVNLTTKALAYATDFSGVRSGRDIDKFEYLKLTKLKSRYVLAPSIMESPVNIECTVNQVIPLGSHHMIIADVKGVTIEKSLLDEKGKFDLSKADLIVYSHGEYFTLGEILGKFGYSVKNKKWENPIYNK